MKCSTWRRHSRTVAAILWLMVSGLAALPNEAPAFTFNNGDLVLALFPAAGQANVGGSNPAGGGTEYYLDLGPSSGFLAPGANNTIDLTSATLGAPFSNQNVIGGTGQQTPQWTLLEYKSGPTSVYTASQNNSAFFNGEAVPPSVGSTYSKIQGWASTLSLNTGATPSGANAFLFLNVPNSASFTSVFGVGANLGNLWANGLMQGSLGSTLTLISGVLNTPFSDAGMATLSASGALTICGGAGCSVAAVPVPAAIVLFGSGLIGLVGIARRASTKTIA